MFDIVSRIVEKGTLLTGRPAEVVRGEMLAAMHEATQFGVRRVKERTSQGVMGTQGGLWSSIEPEVRPMAAGVTGMIGTAYKYGLVVEKGRRPGRPMPPKGSMLRWVRVQMGVPAEKAKSVEFLVRRKIARKGTKGVFMFEQTIKEDWRQFQEIFERHGVRLAEELRK